MKQYDSRDVAKISGTILNSNTRAVASALNINAEILKQVIDRLDILEVGTNMRFREVGEQDG